MFGEVATEDQQIKVVHLQITSRGRLICGVDAFLHRFHKLTKDHFNGAPHEYDW
jgi:hypothetical protein